MELSSNDFGILKEYIYNICGIFLTDNKKYLVRQRFYPIINDLGYSGFEEFTQRLPQNDNTDFRRDIISAITTNETSFFRDIHPFETFANIFLPALSAKITSGMRNRIRIWSAGASTGQEPYSLAMILCEHIEKNKFKGIRPENFEIFATDISPRVLGIAMKASYNDAELSRGLSPERRKKYFREKNGMWELIPEVKDLVRFQKLNFIKPFNIRGGFDIIFCRNVLIYFDAETKEKILKKFYDLLVADGRLMLGSTENIYQMADDFHPRRHGNTLVYEKNAEYCYEENYCCG